MTFPKVTHSGPLNCGYVDENVLAAAVWLNEPEPLVALNHLTVPVAMLYSISVGGEDRSIPDAVAQLGPQSIIPAFLALCSLCHHVVILFKLGIDVGQTSVAKYMARRRRPPSQGWKTFLHNHADGIASIDLFVVPTIAFRLLYGLLILRHDRRQVLWLSATAHPTAEWIARQLTEAFGWEHAPISFAIMIGSMVKSLPDVFTQWAFVTDQRHRDRRGRMDMPNG